MSDLDQLWRLHAATAGVLERRPDFRFDPDFYGRAYPDLDQEPEVLARHFDEIGRVEGRPSNFYTQLHAQHPAIDAVLSDLVTDPQLAEAITAGEPDACQLACELIHLGTPVDAAVSDFSMRGYLAWHPDIERAGMDPLLHYLRYGAVEGGRRTLADVRKGQYRGKRPYSMDRPTCLIAVHEMSRTGAPIVGLELLREASQSHNVIIIALRGGDLLEAFRDHACEIVVTDRPLEDFPYFIGKAFSKIDFAITNSVECLPIVHPLVASDIPFAAYLHEYADYTFPVYKSTVTGLFSDLLIFSSEHVRSSWEGRLKDIEFDIQRDSIILPQRPIHEGSVSKAEMTAARKRLSDVIGRDLSGVRLVCGAGHLQWRKGSDIFAMVAQICCQRDPETVFLWIGDGLNVEDTHFGAWFDYHLRQIGANRPDGNFFLLPAGPLYPDVLAAADMMFLSSRVDPLPNVVFDALERGCRVVYFDGGTGFSDQSYRALDRLIAVEYGNPEAAAAAILDLPRKAPADAPVTPPHDGAGLFSHIHEALQSRLRAQRYFVRGASEIDIPVLFTSRDSDRDLRIREREKMLRYGRRLIWRDLEEAETALTASDNWVHRECKLVPYGASDVGSLPSFAMHIHAYYIDELADDLRRHAAYTHANRIVVTTDNKRKADEIQRIFRDEGLSAETVLVSNRGRDILPFMELFMPGGAAGDDEIWCHVHQKKSLGSARDGDIWRQFMLRILLGNDQEISSALTQIAASETGLVAPFDPHHVPWNGSRALLPVLGHRFPGPLPGNPLLFPVGNMFWVRRQVVEAMNAAFGSDYPWPNEPIANDGTEFHLIERLWPTMTAHSGLRSVFLHKLDERRV